MKEKIQKDFHDAMKAQDKIKKNLLSVVLSEIKTEEGRGKKMDNEAIGKLLRKMSNDADIIILNTQDEEFKNIAKIEKEILNSYLPQLMSEDEIKEGIKKVIFEINAFGISDMGKVMKEFNSRYSGKADNSIVSKIVKEELLKPLNP